MMKRLCKACKQQFEYSYDRLQFCSPECRTMRAPAVYRFICPDGRSYVGGVKDCRKRANKGIQRRNTRLLSAFEKHPPETFVYEVLEYLPPGCSEMVLRTAEQKHIDRLRSWDAETGFNMQTTHRGAGGPAQHAMIEFKKVVLASIRETAQARRGARFTP
jgi:hypothetical protein